MGTCERCQGNGELVVDWEKYLHPASLKEEESSVVECPSCHGYGVDTIPAEKVICTCRGNNDCDGSCQFPPDKVS